MKNSIIILLCVLLATAAVNGQSKKDLELKVSELQSALDSINTDYSSLKTVHDSTSKVLDSYVTMYKTIKEKVLPYEFEPEDLGKIIDSLRSGRDSTFAIILAGAISLQDTVSFMSIGMDSLKTQVDSLKTHVASQKREIAELNSVIEELSTPKIIVSDDQVEALKKIKDLLDLGILTKEEFDSRKKLILEN